MATPNLHPPSDHHASFVNGSNFISPSGSTLPTFLSQHYPNQQNAAAPPPPFVYHQDTNSLNDNNNNNNNNSQKKVQQKKRKKEQSGTIDITKSQKKGVPSVINGKRKMTPMSAFRDENTSNSPSNSASASASAKKKSHAEKFKRNSRACTYCQRLKMKCSGPTADGPCERCRRTGRECMVQERAPRRPWTKKKDMQIQQLTDRLEEMEGLLRNAFDKNVNPNDAAAAMAAAAATIANGGDVQLASQKFAAGVQAASQQTASHQASHQASTSAYLPIPTHSASQPKQSPTFRRINGTNSSPAAINNWLNLTNAPTTPSALNELDLAYVDGHREQLPFVCTGRITPSEAVELFHQCMNSCVLHTVILDPEWHTIPHVGDTSPFLFGVIVLIGSTYHRERRTLRKELQEEMNVLIGQTITTGPKSVEVVQGFLLLYQWNTPSSDPADDRAWLLAGIGIRMATELQLYKARAQTNNGLKRNVSIETDRERINRERCWLMTFLVDRSLSIAVGRSWSISEKAELVRDSEKWCKQPASRPWDQGISAFADLLKTTSRQADVLHTAMSSESNNDEISVFDCETMMRIMNDELEHWRSKWLSRDFYALTSELDKEAAEMAVTRRPASVSSSGAANANANHHEGGHLDKCSPTSSISVNTDALDVHLRTLYYITKQASLRYNFAVLVLNSFGLQYCTTHPNLNHARNFCLTHALRACQGLLKAARDGMGNTMAFAPQTQYTILSFGVISLIKLSSLVDETVEERLIKEVNSCISFLESVAIASDHIAARLASLLRAMLRRREQRKTLRSNGSMNGGSIPSNRSEGRRQSTVDGDTGNRRNGQENAMEEEDDEEARNNYAPGMDVHKLPQRSSRAVTPLEGLSSFEGSTLHSTTANLNNNDALMAESVFENTSMSSQMPIDLGGGDDLMSGFDMESTLQSLGFTGNNGMALWTQMTASEILDDSSWLRLPERGLVGVDQKVA